MAENEISEELQGINKELENNEILKKKEKESAKNRRKYLNRKRRAAAAERMAKKAAKEAAQEPISESTEEELPEEDWSGLNNVPLPIELIDDDEPLIEEDFDRYIPPKKPVLAVNTKKLRAEDVGYEAYKTPEPEVTLKPLPKIGTSVLNPLNLVGKSIDVTSVIERLYGDIGYFIISEQMLPVKDDSIKLVQIKLDDGRCVNMFVRI